MDDEEAFGIDLAAFWGSSVRGDACGRLKCSPLRSACAKVNISAVILPRGSARMGGVRRSTIALDGPTVNAIICSGYYGGRLVGSPLRFSRRTTKAFYSPERRTRQLR